MNLLKICILLIVITLELHVITKSYTMLHFKNVFFMFAEIAFAKRQRIRAQSAADVHECGNNMLN